MKYDIIPHIKNCYLFAAILLLSGCTTLNEAYGRHSLNDRITSSQNHWRTTGSGFHVYGSKSPNSYPSPELQAIVDRLVQVSPLKGFNIRAYVVEDQQLNAAADGNSIYFHKPLLDLLQNDPNKIAGVTAHELSHVIGNHIKAMLARKTIETLAASLATLSENQNANTMIGEVFQLTSLAYDRQAEKEADVMGAAIAHHAGFDSSGLIESLQLMDVKRREDSMKSIALLVPHIQAYNQAVSNYNSNVRMYNLYRSNQAYANAAYWANIANGHAIQVKTMLFQIKSALGMINPLYLSHPPNPQRCYTVNLIRTQELNRSNPYWLYQQDPSVGEIYQVLNARTPRN